MTADSQRSETRFLTGRGRYLVNQPASGAAHAVFLRSPVAHGRIVRCDPDHAKNMPGVLDIITADDVNGAGLGTLPCLAEVATDERWSAFLPPRHLLATERVRHVGEPIAMILAETIDQGKDAAEAIDLDIDSLPIAVDPASVIEPAAPAIWPDRPDNVALDWEAGDRHAVDRAFSEAAHVARLRLINNRLAMMPLETRSARGAFNPSSGHYTLRSGTQGVHNIRSVIAGVLGIDKQTLRVVTDDVGGAFGLKGMAFPEQALVLFAARRIGREVLWVGDRSEAFVSDNAARDHVTEIALALDAEGRMLALTVNTIANMGAYLSNHALNMPTMVYGRVMGGVYAIPAIHMRTRCVFTNTPPVDAYRGAGVPEAIYAIERVIDVAAAETGVDSLALRRRNFLKSEHFPWSTPIGYAIDSGDFSGAMDRALELADWGGFDTRRQASAARGLRRGRGLAMSIHGTGAGTNETARVVARNDGRVIAMSGTQSGGQAHDAMLAEITAEVLGIEAGLIDVLQGDSDMLPRGGGTGGSGSLVIAGRTVTSAAAEMLETARKKAGTLLECALIDLDYQAGAFTVIGTDRSLTLAEIAADMEGGGCTGEADFAGDHRTYPNGVYISEVEVDPETGYVALVALSAVDDIGRVLDLARADGQIIGSLVQGIGQALMEHDRHDPATGQPLSGSFMDYAMPRADDLPPFRLAKHPTPAPTNPLGMKGAGEVGTVGAPPSVIAAVCDATGVRHFDMPATSEKVWRALRESAHFPEREHLPTVDFRKGR
ncbi:MAG: xanthine dehydrogenase family protein molybdopterin-binding subunit [Geminicoccales bacterium]